MLQTLASLGVCQDHLVAVCIILFLLPELITDSPHITICVRSGMALGAGLEKQMKQLAQILQTVQRQEADA